MMHPKTKSAPAIAAALIAVFLVPACKQMTADDLKNALEVTDVRTVWVSKYYQPWPPRLILVPQITFSVKNVGDQPLRFVNFNAVFKFKGDEENLGDGFLATIRDRALEPGETYDPITLTSNFGVEGRNLEHIKGSPMWKPTEVRLFASSKGSRPALLGEWDVSRDIDFQEPEDPTEIKSDASEPDRDT
ncbi:MAG: hypothetical protein SCM96_06280 [Acidobacteriota bacterium]|nr:hypothetical protein [Acidobacteriota bacterium]